jgi:ABC-type antimicrobial peptide transport system permease subunit
VSFYTTGETIMGTSPLQNSQLHLAAQKASDRVEKQVVLPFKKALEIAFKSLKVRFTRSLITTMSLVLAVAFLSFVNVGTDLANGLLATESHELRQDLIRAGYDIQPQDTSIGNTPKQKWIIILSLLVCVVGIVNAQLMAVTERFREIGTMKCLGALDRFILSLFLLEAGMQGLLGAGVGALTGGIFALLNALLVFGGVVLVHLEGNQILISILTAMAVGCLLSLLGVLYPAILAAKMQPVEAMRIEE